MIRLGAFDRHLEPLAWWEVELLPAGWYVDELLVEPAAGGATKIWLNVAGVWKETTVYIRVGGVWKTAAPAINITGTWKT